MEINLAELCDMHPRLPEDLVLLMTARAALGLQKNGHSSPVAISVDVEQVMNRGHLAWSGCDIADLEQHDYNQVTEYGAEAVVLALAYRERGWRVVRRMQREEHADWLLEDTGKDNRQLIAFEVSGVDKRSIAQRIHEKLRQVSRCADVDQRWVGVLGFNVPIVALRSARWAKA